MPEKRSTIGRFEIQEKIGEGPIGAVYKALDPVIRRTVAIKVIKLYTLEESVSFPEIFEKIYRVVRTSTALNHPNICIIYDLSEEKKIPYITMEYIDGHDLEWMLQNRNQLKRSQLLNIMQQTCDALDFAHKKNVIHQDLKSTNILLTPDLHVKITDFGIAGLDEIAAAQTKKLLSIPFYVSPEQALGEAVTPASDLFSLGVITYQLLSGELPFPGTSAANVIMMIARDNPVVPKNFERSGIDRTAWDEYFGRALAKSPEERFRSAKEMLDGLTSLIPTNDRIRYPYIHSVPVGDSTSVIERSATSEPTILIDAARMFDEAGAFAPDQLEEEPEKADSVESQAEQSAFALLNSAGSEDYPEEPAPATVMVNLKDQLPEPPAKPTVLIEPHEEEERFVQEPVLDLLPPDPPTPPPIEMPKAPPTELIDYRAASKKVGASTSEMQMGDVPPTEIISGDIAARAPNSETLVPPRVTPNPVPPPPPRTPAPTMRPTPTPTPRSTPPPPPNRATPPPSRQTLRPDIPPQAKTPPPVAPAYSAPQPQQSAAVQPKGAKSALKIYLIIALAAAAFIGIAGFLFFSSAGKKKEVVEKPPVVAPPVVKPKPPQQQEVTIVPTVGTLRITSEPPGASVLLNNSERGVTPLEISEVPFGKYGLLVKLKGYKDQQQDVELNADTATLDVPITLEKAAPTVGTLVIESTPDGAFIVMSNKVVGVTPKNLANTKTGKYNITLKKDGYQDYTGTVRVKQDQTAKFTGALTAIPKVVVPPPPPPVKPKEPELKPGTLVALGPGVTPPKSVKKTFPKFPDAAKKLKIQGVVGLSLLVTETGRVAEVKLTRSAHQILDNAAIEAAKTWVYEPARKNGVVVKVWLPVSISFQSGH